MSPQDNYTQTLTYSFAQPKIAGIGYVLASGLQDNAKLFLPYSLTVTKLGTGQYRINHKLGHTKYIASLTVVGAASVITASNHQNDSVQVNVFNTGGTAIDSDFQFVLHEVV